VKRGLILGYEPENYTYLNELDILIPLVVSISQKSEELWLKNLV
jgi:hypothetical protein